jgi:hypothetical protein
MAIVICYLAINNYTPKPKKKSLSDTVISVTASSPPLTPYPSKPYRFEGIYKVGYFDNCCFNGHSRETKYSYLQLPYKLKIKWDDQASALDLEFDQIQIRLEKESDIADGTFSKLQCKQIWEGGAASVYCSEPVLSVN